MMGIDNKITLGNVLLSLSEALDLADPEISFHQQRTAFIAYNIAEYTPLNDWMIRNVFVSALFHDVGAISVEEKVAVHNFDENSTELHCIRGELLLKRFDIMKTVSRIVRFHHRKWSEWDKSIDDPVVMGSQIINLADYIERLISKSEHILFQTDRILEIVDSLSGDFFHPVLVEHFKKIAVTESFWLDLVSPKIYSELLHSSPVGGIPVDLDHVETISKLFRDIIDFKSSHTAAHSVGVSACGELLARLTGFTGKELQNIKIAGNLHDIGKLMMPSELLDRNGRLSEDEIILSKSHPYYSYHIIRTIRGLEPIAEMAGFHHERLNGSGYPFHLKEKDLSLGAKIIMAADVFTALVEERPYRKGLSKSTATGILNDMIDRGELDRNIAGLAVREYDMISEHIASMESSIREFYETRFGRVN